MYARFTQPPRRASAASKATAPSAATSAKKKEEISMRGGNLTLSPLTSKKDTILKETSSSIPPML
jgi:hypothetical protein